MDVWTTYKKIKVIGRGSFGFAYLCNRKSDGESVVVKEIYHYANGEKDTQGLINEIQVLSMLRHPNITAYYDSFTTDYSEATSGSMMSGAKKLLIVMEYADGEYLVDPYRFELLELECFFVIQKGGTLWDHLQNEKSFLDEHNLPAMVMKIMRGMIDPPPEHYSNQIKELLSGCLKFKAEERFNMGQIISLPMLQHVLLETHCLSSAPSNATSPVSNISNGDNHVSSSNNVLTNNREFEVLAHIGTGSYGEVYKAKLHSTGELVALKVIKLDPGEEIDEVIHEVNFLRECDHVNIVKFCNCYQKKGPRRGQKQFWIAMEYCGGGSVDTLLTALRGPLKEDEISCIGLDFLHSRNKIHRDIKCGNILLTESGGIKLGIDQKIVIPMAPEVIDAENFNTSYDHKADIWSLGITAIEMAECKPPLFELHPMKVLKFISKQDPPKLKDDHWSNNFKHFLSLCLEKNPDRRPNAAELLSHPFVAENPKKEQVISNLIIRSRNSAIHPETSSTDEDEDDDDEECDPQVIPNPIQENDKGSQGPAVTEDTNIKAPSTVPDEGVQSTGGGVEAAVDSRVGVSIPEGGDTPSGTSTPPPSTANSNRPTFKATRLCRLGLQVNCAEFIENTLLLGTNDGLYAYEIAANSTITLLSPRRYVQLEAIEELGIVVSRSGKYEVVATHDISAMTRVTARRSRFETETKLKKMKETKGCLSFSISKMKDSVYLCVIMPKVVQITKWAPHPFNRFMKFKDIPVDYLVKSIDVVELSPENVKIYLATNTRFKCYDSQKSTIEEITPPGVEDDKVGMPLRCVLFNERLVVCYEKIGLVTDFEGEANDTKQFRWRNSLSFAGKLGEEFLAAGTKTAVDIVNHRSGKIVHVFETSRSKIKGFEFLFAKGNRLFLLAEDGGATRALSIITINLGYGNAPTNGEGKAAQ
ncbi:Mitogen-activated protein kinase kinase kinase kinase 3 [Nowakowskiella sp. JEL0407]|nr:Mitogen-activated protein kinase kinase kinase kinase 3 [Nowakowskiella sp. JEL0407]